MRVFSRINVLFLTFFFSLGTGRLEAREPGKTLQSRALVTGCDEHQQWRIGQALRIMEFVSYLVYEATGEGTTNLDVRSLYRFWFKNWQRRDLRDRIHRLFGAIYLDCTLSRRQIEIPDNFRQFRFRCDDIEDKCGKWLTSVFACKFDGNC